MEPPTQRKITKQKQSERHKFTSIARGGSKQESGAPAPGEVLAHDLLDYAGHQITWCNMNHISLC